MNFIHGVYTLCQAEHGVGRAHRTTPNPKDTNERNLTKTHQCH